MDPTAFDRLTRLISASASRRGALAALLGALGTAHVSEPETSARRHHAKGQNRRRDGGQKRDSGKHRKRRAKKRKGKTGAGPPAGQCCNRQDCAPGQGKNLAKCCFEDQDLTAKNFRGANLGEASFARANLTASDFTAANLDQTCFVDANTTGARFGAANRGAAIFCRTETSSGLDDSGCHRGTPCCPTCDATHPCTQDQVCCAGRCVRGECCDNGERSACGSGQVCCDHRCVAGDCCEADDCPNEVCQRRACRDDACVYTPVFDEPGPGCPDPRLCCRDEQGGPVCCDAGVTNCQASGVCGCAGDQDCGDFEVCCDGRCVGGECCRDQDCPPETCQNRTCQDHVCVYTPVRGAPGPGCDTICCQDAAGTLRCCPPGATTCDARGRCCTAQSRDATCGVGTPAPKCGEVVNNCGQRVNCGGCAERTCQTATCSEPDHTCVYTPVFAAPGTHCPDPRLCCRDLQGDPICCAEETRQCEAFGVCGCPECECLGTPNRLCSLFSTKTCCPGMVCTPVPTFPLLTTCQFPCENNQQCRDVFGPGYRCTDGDDCTFIGKCCQIPGDRGAGVSKVGWPRDGDQFDALAKLVWTRTSRGAALGTMAGVALPWRTRSAAFGPKGKTGFAAGPGATRAPRRARR